MEFGLWIVRYAATIAVFAIGMKAPGISQARDYVQQIDEEDAESGGQQRRSSSEGSTWRGLWRKLRVLLPYLWPKKSYLLQGFKKILDRFTRSFTVVKYLRSLYQR